MDFVFGRVWVEECFDSKGRDICLYAAVNEPRHKKLVFGVSDRFQYKQGCTITDNG